MSSVRGARGRPSPAALWSVTGRGEVLAWDPRAARGAGEDRGRGELHTVQLEAADTRAPVVHRLTNGFGPGSTLYLEVRHAH